MNWVESPGKDRNTSELLQEFERRFSRLSALDRTVLDTSRMLFFIKSVDALYRERVGPLLETNEGLTTDWAVVKGVCNRFDKRHEWSNEGPLAVSAATGRKLEEPIPARIEETRRWIESGTVPMNVVKGPSGGVALEELTRMVWDL